MKAGEVVHRLGLAPHPEGGHFLETWRAAGPGRPAGTSILYLLAAGESARWHRLDADEVWHFHAGDPLELVVAAPGAPLEWTTLGPDLAAGHAPQAVVPAHAWQSAASLGAWTLVGCTMAPGFDPAGWELAPEGWTPEGG